MTQLRVRLYLFGPMSLSCEGEGVALPRGTKARVLLALLAASPGQSRPRSFLVRMLWSNRGQSQGLSSLRQAIREIRLALGPASGAFLVDRQHVCLSPTLVSSDWEDGRAATAEGHIFLEDLPALDPAADNWIQQVREGLGGRAHMDKRPAVAIRMEVATADFHQRVLGYGLAETMRQWTGSDLAVIAEPTTEAGAPPVSTCLDLTGRLELSDNRVAVHLSANRPMAQGPLWSHIATLPADPTELMESEELSRLVNRTVDRLLLDLASTHGDRQTRDALNFGALGAASRIFRNQGSDLAEASALLDRNFELHRAGIYRAWRAYITTLELGEAATKDRREIADKARDLATEALELDPYGSMTLALCSYVTSFILGDLHEGHRLASRAIDSNTANPLAWLFRGAAHFLAGDGEKALPDTGVALAIQGGGPYEYVILSFRAAAAACAGRLEEARVLSESAARLAPSYRPPLRLIVAIHAAQGDIDALRLAIRRLRVLEPDFTIDMLKDQAYPVPSLRTSRLVNPD